MSAFSLVAVFPVSFLPSADICCLFGETIHPTAIVSEEVNRKYLARNYNFQVPTPTPSVTIYALHCKQRDNSIMTIADHATCCSMIS